MKLLTCVVLSFTLYRASLAIPLDQDGIEIMRRNADSDLRIGESWSDSSDVSHVERELSDSDGLNERGLLDSLTHEKRKSPPKSSPSKGDPSSDKDTKSPVPPKKLPVPPKKTSEPTKKPSPTATHKPSETKEGKPTHTSKADEPNPTNKQTPSGQCRMKSSGKKGGGTKPNPKANPPAKNDKKQPPATQGKHKRWPGAFENLFPRVNGEEVTYREGQTIKLTNPVEDWDKEPFVLGKQVGGPNVKNFLSPEYFLKGAALPGEQGNNLFQTEAERTEDADEALKTGLWKGSGDDEHGKMWIVLANGGVTFEERWGASRPQMSVCVDEAKKVMAWVEKAQRTLFEEVCFIHADMHGGNILVPPSGTAISDENIRLIDFADVRLGLTEETLDEAIKSGLEDWEPPFDKCQGEPPCWPPEDDNTGGDATGKPDQSGKRKPSGSPPGDRPGKKGPKKT